MATIDVLGEEIASADEAAAIARAYHDVLARIEDEGLDANVSVKLDRRSASSSAASSAARTSRRSSATPASAARSSASTWRTPRRPTRRSRSSASCARGARQRRRRAPVAAAADARRRRGPRRRPALQGHLPRAGGDRVPGSGRGARELRALPRGAARAGQLRRGRDARRGADRRGAAAGRASAASAPDEYEFQMLLGVTPERADELVRDGHRLRVYVPFGTHWYEYSLRRLKENPTDRGLRRRRRLRRLRPRRRLGTSSW